MDLDLFDDLLGDNATKNNVRAGGKFQPKAKPRPFTKKKDSVGATQPVSENVNCAGASEAVVVDCLPDNNNDILHSIFENTDIFIGLESLDDDFLSVRETVSDDPVSSSEEPYIHVSGSPGDAEHKKLATPVAHVVDDSVGIPSIHDLDTSEFTSSYGQRIGKFRPKLKQQGNRLGNDTDVHDHKSAAEPVNNEQHTPFVSPSVDILDLRPVAGFNQDDVFECSSEGVSKDAPSQSVIEVLVDETFIDFEGFSHQEVVTSGENLEADHALPGNLVSPSADAGKAKVVPESDCSFQQHRASTSNETIVASGRVFGERKRPINAHKLVDESEVEGLENSDIQAESLSNSFVNEYDMAEELRSDDKTQKRKTHNTSKKLEAEKEKPVRKRPKKITESSEPAKSGPKRFSHSSQRRQVDKALLEIPDDEIDIQKLVMKDAIWLTDLKTIESVKKEAKSSKEQLQNQRNVNHNVDGDEDGTFGEVSDGEESFMVEESCVNYHTFMAKTPRSRWSKQDTEVLYQAFRLHGTDFSTIQVCSFPDKTPRQIKLKFKKEGQQHAWRINEALTKPVKEQYQLLILNQVTARIQDFCRANSVSLTEEEENPDANDEAANSEEIDEAAKPEEIDEAVFDGNTRAEVAVTQGPAVDPQDDDDDDDALPLESI
ncbi:OLC1v1025726C1 [Oldenlandia corymbosa var. corymbosa]|uniref:OLC1v1025726C1 n=1 Tax=Oldenlandia corymbosa var. corymbosa TaxID=529605 RepID=A0AAV1C8T9_OLDCO|nr:OLC1v1025726C1 [Oldenlandia corymbosa var. corymbosa]